MAGQSNGVGCGAKSRLTTTDRTRIQWAGERVFMAHGASAPITLSEDFETSVWFGPELFFALDMAEAFPSETMLIVKAAKDGMAIEHEISGSPGRLTAESKMNEGIELLNKIAPKAALDGVLWIQGEADSQAFTTAYNYLSNLQALILNVRAKYPQVPFAVSDSHRTAAKWCDIEYGDWVNSEMIRASKRYVSCHFDDVMYLNDSPEYPLLSYCNVTGGIMSTVECHDSANFGRCCGGPGHVSDAGQRNVGRHLAHFWKMSSAGRASSKNWNCVFDSPRGPSLPPSAPPDPPTPAPPPPIPLTTSTA